MPRCATLLSTALLLAAACKGEDEYDGPLRITGPNGASVVEAAAVTAVGSCTLGAVPVEANMLVHMFSTAPGVCEDLAQAVTPPSSTTAFVTVARFAANGEPTTILMPETFRIVAPGAPLPPPDARGSAAAFVTVERFGGAIGAGQGCEVQGLSTGVSGSVTVRTGRVENERLLAVVGEVDAALDDGGRVEGTFDVPVCAGASDRVRADCTAVAIPAGTTCQ